MTTSNINNINNINNNINTNINNNNINNNKNNNSTSSKNKNNNGQMYIIKYLLRLLNINTSLSFSLLCLSLHSKPLLTIIIDYMLTCLQFKSYFSTNHYICNFFHLYSCWFFIFLVFISLYIYSL